VAFEISNAGEPLSGSVAFPDEDMQRALMDRLIARSNDPHGFDRTILRELNSEAWGTPGE